MQDVGSLPLGSRVDNGGASRSYVAFTFSSATSRKDDLGSLGRHALEQGHVVRRGCRRRQC